ncbi:MAG: NAD(P)-dependent oxidoreductase, partial [Patescibacteria group bacterium]
DLRFVTLKICDTYGKDDTRPKIMALFKRISETEETLAMSPGDQLLDILYINDVISGFIQLILLLDSNELSNDEYILRAEKRYSLKELASIFSHINNKDLNIVWGGRPYREREVMIPWAKGILVPGWKPAIDIETGIKQFLDKL